MSSRPLHPVAPIEDALFVTILKTADRLAQQAEQIIKPSGLTATQYNVLRILRGAEPHGLSCRVIGDRMISRDPDMTRLLDRLEKQGCITRARQTDDRRVIKTRITAEGLKQLKKLDRPVHELHQGQFRHMSPVKLKQLAELLAEVASAESESRPAASNEKF
ncbi:MAG TPA: MarR family transcriptional regulator [Methylomirabilota bacterium]|nr:MarR family transcriptional regulator [Methylomirabilota bacterium]